MKKITTINNYIKEYNGIWYYQDEKFVKTIHNIGIFQDFIKINKILYAKSTKDFIYLYSRDRAYKYAWGSDFLLKRIKFD